MWNKKKLFFAFLFISSLGYAQWNAISSPTSLQLQSIYFPTSAVGYAGGADGTFKTTDGGNSWNKINYSGVDSVWLEGLNIQYIYASSATDVIIAGWNIWSNSEAIIRTADGGNTWTKEYIGPFDTRVTAISFPTNTVGYTSGEKGRILKTTDAGDNWTLVTSGTTQNLSAIYFTHPDTGYAGGENILLKTVDGGQTWTPSAFPDWIRSLHFTSTSIGYAGSIFGTIYQTTDGGKTWKTQFKNGLDINDITFTNDNVGYAAAGSVNSGVIFKTSTAGKYWEPQPTSKVGASRLAVCFINDATGFSVGESGTIIKTINKGGDVAPSAWFTPDHTVFCKDTLTTFLNNGPPNYTYRWSLDNAQVATSYNLPLTLNASTTYTISLVASNGIYKDSSQQVITTEGSLDFVLTSSLADSNFCAGSSFTYIRVPSSESGVMYQLHLGNLAIGPIQSGDGNTLVFPTDIIHSNTTYNILAQKINACGTNSKIDYHLIKVLPLPNRTVNVKGMDSLICESRDSSSIEIYASELGISYQLKHELTPVGNPVAGNGGTINLPTGRITDTITFNIYAINNSTGCNTILAKRVKFEFENPKAILTASSINSTLGESITIYNSSLNKTSCLWDFGSTASTVNSNSCGNHTISFSSLGSKPIRLTVTSASGCKHTTNDTLYVYDPNLQPKDCWGMAFGGNMQDDGKGVVMDDFSNLYITGEYGDEGGRLDSKTGVSGKLPGKGMFLAKYNTYGTLKWLTHIAGSTGEDIVIGKSGALYITGECSTSYPVFYSVDGTSIKPPTTIGVGGYLAKYSSDGKLLWATYFSYPGVNLSIDANENIFVAGVWHGGCVIYSVSGSKLQFETFETELRYFVAKYNSAGEALWLKNTTYIATGSWSSNGNHYFTSGLATDGSGNCYLAAETHNYVSFMRKYDPLGNTLWTKNLATKVTGLAVDKIGNSYISSYGSNSLLSKYNSSGNLEWLNKNPTPPFVPGLGDATTVKLDSYGNIYLAGYGSFLNLPASHSSFFLARYSNAGVIQWATLETGLTSNSTNQAFTAWPHSLIIDKEQNCFLLGELGTTINGPAYIIHKDTLRTQLQDVLFVKYTPNGCLDITSSSTASSLGPLCPGDSLNVSYSINNLTVNSGNSVVSELSDSSGSFLNTIYTISSLTSTNNNGIIKGVLPNNIPYGTKYRVRVRLTNPAISSSDNGQNITVNAVPPATAGQNVLICKGASVQLNATGGNAYLWKPSTGLNDPTISNPIANPIVTTTYTVTISDNAYVCNKKDTLRVNVKVCTTVDEHTVPIVEVVPNPTTGMVLVSSSDPVSELVVTDVLGRVVYNAVDDTSFKIDISSNEKGIYMLHLKINDRVYSKKMVLY